jgi:hypothetical protein
MLLAQHMDRLSVSLLYLFIPVLFLIDQQMVPHGHTINARFAITSVAVAPNVLV